MSGRYRTRTYDPTDVNRVLYQLSQPPLDGRYSISLMIGVK